MQPLASADVADASASAATVSAIRLIIKRYLLGERCRISNRRRGSWFPWFAKLGTVIARQKREARLCNRETGRSSTPRPIDRSIRDVSGILDHPLEPVIGRRVAPTRCGDDEQGLLRAGTDSPAARRARIFSSESRTCMSVPGARQNGAAFARANAL